MSRLSDLLILISEKTNQRKIPWSTDDNGTTLWARIGKNVLEISIDPGLFGQGDTYEIKLRNSDGDVVEDISAGAKQVEFGILSNLHEEARRQALRIDMVIDELEEILAKL